MSTPDLLVNGSKFMIPYSDIFKYESFTTPEGRTIHRIESTERNDVSFLIDFRKMGIYLYDLRGGIQVRSSLIRYTQLIQIQ